MNKNGRPNFRTVFLLIKNSGRTKKSHSCNATPIILISKLERRAMNQTEKVKHTQECLGGWCRVGSYVYSDFYVAEA